MATQAQQEQSKEGGDKAPMPAATGPSAEKNEGGGGKEKETKEEKRGDKKKEKKKDEKEPAVGKRARGNSSGSVDSPASGSSVISAYLPTGSNEQRQGQQTTPASVYGFSLVGWNKQFEQRQRYYHGLLPREDVELLLLRNGDWLIRETDHDGHRLMAITVRWNDQPMHVLIFQEARTQLWYISQKRRFNSVPDLVEHYRSTKEPVTTDGAVLKNAINRRKWQLNHEDIVLVRKIGSGAFGQVYKAELIVGKKRIDVAVKTLRVSPQMAPSKKDRATFVTEARIMKKYRHANVVRLYGIAAAKDPIMIVMEYAAGGSLLSHIRHIGASLPAAEHVRFCVEAARGMHYLQRRGCIHRDVACRNCLLSDTEAVGSGVVKITDFGLSKEAHFMRESAGSGTKMPLKWLAPEIIRASEYSHASDVWAFGVLVWEVFADGGEPYADMSGRQAVDFVNKGHRMHMPKGTPEPIVSLVASCWSEQRDARPDFNTVAHVLGNVQKQVKKDTTVRL